MQLFNISGIERKEIQAAAATQIVTGAAVGFHPGRSIDSPFDIMRVFLVKLDVFWKYEISDKFDITNGNIFFVLLKESGGRADRVILCHIIQRVSIQTQNCHQQL